jgi:hypothetical protein
VPFMFDCPTGMKLDTRILETAFLLSRLAIALPHMCRCTRTSRWVENDNFKFLSAGGHAYALAIPMCGIDQELKLLSRRGNEYDVISILHVGCESCACVPAQ